MNKNPIKQLDELIIENDWAKARALLSSMTPLQAAHAVLTTMVWIDRTADDKDWELFNENLADTYLFKEGEYNPATMVQCPECGHIDSLQAYDCGGADDDCIFCNQCGHEFKIPDNAEV